MYEKGNNAKTHTTASFPTGILHFFPYKPEYLQRHLAIINMLLNANTGTPLSMVILAPI